MAGIILPNDNFAPGWTTSGKTLVFTKNDLYGYIDGGAELFLEFGFKELIVQNYRQGENEIVLEVYQMESPESALGIYLMKCGEETPIEGIDARNSGNKYQFTVVKGSCFLQVNSFAGDEKLIPVMTLLIQQTLKFIARENPVKIFDTLPKENLVPGSELIVRGFYALQPIYTFGEGDILQLKGKIFGAVGDYKEPDNSRYTQLVIKYPIADSALSAYHYLLTNLDSYLKVEEKWETGFIFQDFQAKFGLVKVRKNVLDIKIKLSQKPIDKN